MLISFCLLCVTPCFFSSGVPAQSDYGWAPLTEQDLCKNPREPFLMWSTGNQRSPSSPLSTAPRNLIEGQKKKPEDWESLESPGKWRDGGWGGWSLGSSSQLAQGTLTAGNMWAQAGRLKTLYRLWSEAAYERQLLHLHLSPDVLQLPASAF